MNCPRDKDEIYRYLDGHLSTPERVELEAHLAGCPVCRQKVAAARALFTRLAELPDAPVPGDLATGVMARLPHAPVPLRTQPMIGLLVAQLAASLVCLALAAPRLATWAEEAGRWLAPGWLAESAALVGARVQAAWIALRPDLSLDVDLSWVHGWGLSWPQAALIAVALVGLWLVGNRLLLAGPSNERRGTR